MTKGESTTILLHHRITKIEKLVVRVMGQDLKLNIEPTSRVEVTLLRRWQPPELLISGKVYPWGSQTLSITNNIEEYRSLHITGQNGSNFIAKTISPLGMMHDKKDPMWKISVEDHIALIWDGEGHKTLKITANDGYKMLSIYGER